MKPVHDKVPVQEFTPGSVYRIAMNGEELYDAEVVKFHGGCWATVRVRNVIEGAHSQHYTADMEFDIKVANYHCTLLH